MSLNWKELGPYDRVYFRGFPMNARDAAMVLDAERRFGATVAITQGPFHPGVGASSGTHDGGGAIDWSLSGMSSRRKRKWDRAVKDTGWCAWHRPYVYQLWPEHEHGVARGCRNLSELARWQADVAFDARKSGLVDGAYDGSYRPDPEVEFQYRAWVRAEMDRRQIAQLREDIGTAFRVIRGYRNRIATKFDQIKAKRKRIDHIKEH